VGSGSGYLTSCFAHLVGPGGKVIGIDHIPELVEKSIDNIKKDNSSLWESGVIEMKCGDGRLGWREGGPFDAIHVGAYSADVPEAVVLNLFS
jgi:protein-L-isoaspartate(D-aspartate) O-methyltransferase